MRQSTCARALAAAGGCATIIFSTGGVALGQTAAPEPDAPAAPTATQTGATAAPGPRAATTLTVAERKLDVRAGNVAVARGTLLPGRAGQRVRLERLERGRWRRIATDRTAADGDFALRHRTTGADSSLVRVRFAGDTKSREATLALGRLNAFRPALASWYGPGFFGNPLGCGGRLAQDTVGVAHKTLPCGTAVVLRKGGRTVRAKVIDRGPYVGAREFDLTAATKDLLGFDAVGRVWVAH